MKKYIPILIFAALIGSWLIFGKLNYVSNPVVVINEVCNKNGTIVTQDGHAGDDYIELYNTTDKKVSIEGWCLSDDPEELDKQMLPNIEIEPNGFFVLYANGENDSIEELNFKISSNGETIFLSNTQGELVDQIYVPDMDMDNVYARKNDGESKWGVLTASLGESNQNSKEAAKIVLEAPVLSHTSGFYDEEFVLTIDSNRGTHIYYTTDGSVPTEDSYLYEDGITIKNRSAQENVINGTKRLVADWNDYQLLEEKADKATVIRAIAIGKNNQVSEVVTETYFVGLDKYADKNVLSIVVDPEKIIGEEGVFVTGTTYDDWYISDSSYLNGEFEWNWPVNYELTNFWKKGREAEVLGNVQLFESEEQIINQTAGIRVRGNYTRLADKKSLQLTSRNVYSGSSVFERNIFEEYPSHEVYVSAVLDKAYCMELAENRNMGLQDTKECVTFINGEYWYDAAFMEQFDELYFEHHFDVNSENVLLIKDTTAQLGEDYQYIYDELLDYLRNEEISVEEKCAYLYEHCDIQSMIDWLVFNLYLGNHDLTYKRNSILWRTIEPEDGMYGDCKWRWIVSDIDRAASEADPTETDLQEYKIVCDNRFYRTLRTSPNFCRQFVITAMDMMNTNFSKENVVDVLGEWGLDISHYNGYFLKRPQYMIEALWNEFGLTGTVEEVCLNINDSEAGRIYINTIEVDMTDGTWNGKYFTDYSVNIRAVANPGYRFVGWSGTYELAEKSIDVGIAEGGISLTAVFERE